MFPIDIWLAAFGWWFPPLDAPRRALPSDVIDLAAERRRRAAMTVRRGAVRRAFVTMPERNAMRAMRRANVSLSAIEAAFDRANQTVRRHCADIPANVPVGQKTILTPEKRAALMRDRDDGWSYRMLTRRYGIAHGTAMTVVCVERRKARQTPLPPLDPPATAGEERS